MRMKMKIAVATEDGKVISEHFGGSPYLLEAFLCLGNTSQSE